MPMITPFILSHAKRIKGLNAHDNAIHSQPCQINTILGLHETYQMKY